MKKLMLMSILFIALFIVGCNQDEQTFEGQANSHEQIERTVSPHETIETEPSYPYHYPLTGIGSEEESNQRIISVMLNNHPEARPQSGLSKADLVIEILSEGQTTRLLTMFHSQMPEIAGPVRSAREYYFELADDYNALYVYHGAAGFIEEMLRQGAADHLNGAYYDNDGRLFRRESFRNAPHNSYVLFDAINDVATSSGYTMEASYEPLSFLTNEEAESLTGDPATEVTLRYGNESVRYVYDESDQRYARYNNQSQTVELNDSTPIKLDNVFILETFHEVIDSAGRRNIDFQSGGQALLIQRGVSQQVEWENREGRLIPVRDGNPVELIPGQTWINVVPTSTGINQVEVR